MRRIFIKITPFFILTLLGLIATIVEIVLLLLSKDKGELATGILLILVIIFSSFLLLDRYLIKKFEYKKIILSEIIVLLILPFLVLFRRNLISYIWIQSPIEATVTTLA